jgi:hypothetical protein
MLRFWEKSKGLSGVSCPKGLLIYFEYGLEVSLERSQNAVQSFQVSIFDQFDLQ